MRKLQISKQLPLGYTPPEVTGNGWVDTAQILSSWGSGLPLPRLGALNSAVLISAASDVLQLESGTRLHKAGLSSFTGSAQGSSSVEQHEWPL